MKFKFAVSLSVILHVSLFAIALYVPASDFGKGETIYYVDFIHMPGGGGGDGSPGGGGIELKKVEAASVKDSGKGVKDLTVKKDEAPESRLRYPDKGKEKDKKKPEPRKIHKKEDEQDLISVVRKDKRQAEPGQNSSGTRISSADSSIRIGTGTGTGTGSGSGTGSGFGSGGFGSTFPYSYYIDTLRTKISSSWYSSLVSPGLRGKFVAVVYFKILRDGTIRDVGLEQKSGIDALDLSALRAVDNAAPFPPLPNDFPYRYLGVHFEFEWEK